MASTGSRASMVVYMVYPSRPTGGLINVVSSPETLTIFFIFNHKNTFGDNHNFDISFNDTTVKNNPDVMLNIFG